MKRHGKRLISWLLVLVMTLALLPAAVYADVGTLVRNSAEKNAALLQALQDQFGEDAETYLALLKSYGLVDEIITHHGSASGKSE